MLQQVFLNPTRIHSKNSIYNDTSNKKIQTGHLKEKWLASITMCIGSVFAANNMTNRLNIFNIAKYYLTGKTVFLLDSQGLEIHNNR